MVRSGGRTKPDNDGGADSRPSPSLSLLSRPPKTESMLMDHFRSLEVLVPRILNVSVVGTVLFRRFGAEVVAGLS